MKKPRSKPCVMGDLCSLEMRTVATAKMTRKGIKRVEIDVRKNVASSLYEAAEMSGCSNISNGAVRGVSIAFEVIGEGIDVWSTDSTPQAS